MKDNSLGDFSKLDDDVKQHIFSFFNTRDFSRTSQTSKGFNKALWDYDLRFNKTQLDYRLRMEYNQFVLFFKMPMMQLSGSWIIEISRINSYEKYCKILFLDKDFLTQITDNPLNFIHFFTSRLGEFGCISSLHCLYDTTRMSNKQVFDTYRKELLTKYPQFPEHEEWLTSTIRNCKKVAIMNGYVDILKKFFPNIVSSSMLASIIGLIDSAYLFAAKELSRITDEDLKSQKMGQQALAENIGEYRESTRYLLEKGVVFDLSDNCKSGAVSYVKDYDSSISILEFCERYKDEVSNSVRALFDLILEHEFSMDVCLSSQTDKDINKELLDNKLRMEFREFRKFLRKSFSLDMEIHEFFYQLDNYEKYYRLICFDTEASQSLDIYTLYHFTPLLACSGALYSLQCLTNEQAFNTYRESVLVHWPKFPVYEQWLVRTVHEAKACAIRFGHINILKEFFPDMVSSPILASIFDIVDSAYLFADKQRVCSEDDVIHRLSIKQQKISQKLLKDHMKTYKESVTYLLGKGVVFDRSDNDHFGAVSKYSDSSISIKKFCELYKDSVSDIDRELFNLILEPEPSCQLAVYGR